MDTLESEAMDELCRRFAGFFRYAKTLEMLATGIQSGAIKVPKYEGRGAEFSGGDHTKQKNLCVKAFQAFLPQ